MYLDCNFFEQVIQTFLLAQILFPSSATSKNAFIAFIVVDPDKSLELANSQCEYGGLLGPGNSKLISLMKGMKLFRLDAAFHAFGFMKRQYNLGPGYVYTLGEKPLLKTIAFSDNLQDCLFGFTSNFVGPKFIETGHSNKKTPRFQLLTL